ncbi:MAG: ankyrin repeat domain-containing protein [Spirochaetia bacterium]|jgi:ankyrin repeat protein|nr:ankyrin repeat domain-containing protein [Spirochaetia bacterium]
MKKTLLFKIILITVLLFSMNSCIYMLPFMLDKKEKPSIHVLIRKNQYEDVKALLAENPSLANIADTGISGNTPLGTAAWDNTSGHSFIKLLLEYGADPNKRGISSDYRTKGKLPLEIALETRSAESAKLLLDSGADPDALTSDGAPLMEKAFDVNEEMVRYFIKKGAAVKSDRLLYLAIVKRYSPELFKFFQKKGLDIFQIDGNGQSLLHIAARFGGTDIAQALILSGLDVNLEDKNGSRPLHSGCEGSIYLMKTASVGGGVVTPVFRSSIETARLLYFAGTYVNAKDKSGKTALHIAAKYGYPDIVKFLVEKGADPAAADNLGYNALHYAAAGLDVNIQNSGYIPYHQDNPAIAEYLINRGLDVNSRTGSGESVLDIAKKSNASADLLRLLISKGAK